MTIDSLALPQSAAAAIPSTRKLRFAMLGMNEGNGHPYSWSAIVNGFDRAAMADCPYPLIPQYLGRQPAENIGFADAAVTHIWTDNLADAEHVARAAKIPTVVARAEEVIGEVDAVFIATDRGYEHVERCRPFVEAGLPIFIDKPMVDNETDLRQVCEWVEAGARIMSSSSMRYCKEYLPWQLSTANLGKLKLATLTVPKNLEQYGIHALEGLYSIVGPGFLSCRHLGTRECGIVHYRHACGAELVVHVLIKSGAPFGLLQLMGSDGYAEARCEDYYYAFRTQILDFVKFVKTGQRPYAFSQTVELMKTLIAALHSRDQQGREIAIDTIGELEWTS